MTGTAEASGWLEDSADDAAQAGDDAGAAVRGRQEVGVVLEVESHDDLTRQLLRLELLELRVPVVRVVAADQDGLAAAVGRDDAARPLLDLNLGGRLVDGGRPVHLDGDE